MTGPQQVLGRAGSVRRLDTSMLQALAVASQMGIILGAAVVVGLLLGSWLDSLLGTGPVFAIIGSLIGLAAGVYSSAQLAMFILRRWRRPTQKR